MFREHKPAVSSNDAEEVIPQKRELTDTRMIKCDFSGKTNTEDGELTQLAVVARVVFENDDEKVGRGIWVKIQAVQVL